MIRKSPKISIISLSILFFVIFYLLPVSANSLNVTLVSPENNKIFNATNNVTFVCNATSDQYIKTIGLYHDLNGSFVLNQTSYFGELEPDSSTVLLMHFNNDSSVEENDTFIYDWSGNGNNGYTYGASFNSNGKFLGSYEFNNSNNDYIEINDSQELNLANGGSVEFWLRPTSTSKWRIVLFKGTGVTWSSSPYTFRLEDSSNEICLYVSNSYDVITNLCSQNGLSLNTWYHILGTWNSTHVSLYVNGLLNGTYSWDAGEFPLLESSYPVTIGKTDTGLTQWYAYYNGSIDELAMHNKSLSYDEIQEHYQRNLINSTTQNWTINNTQDGSYKWNCLAEDSLSLTDWSDTNYTFHVDTNTPPTMNAITLSPSSEDDIDPGVIINITANVTDVSNVSTVIFQWKRKLDPNWTNDTMDYNSLTELYENASINASEEGVYEYRIWSNDTNGYSNLTLTQNVSAVKDYTWSVTPTNLGTVSGLINTIGYVGNLTINNTGDGTLYFNLSHNWPLPMYFNGSENSLSFSLTEKNVAFINITIQFAGQDSESTTNIIVDASHDLYTPSPESSTINLTVSSFTGGPYFLVDITEYSSSVSQSQTVNLTAKLKNIGNETAIETWFNWTLPTGWSNTSGNVEKYIGDISSDTIVWSNLTVNINPSLATAGVVTLYVTASSAENATGNDSVIIAVSCSNTDSVCGAGCTYLTDNDCSVPSGPSGGDGGDGTPVQYSVVEEKILLLSTEESFELVRGLNDTFILKITNPSEYNDFQNVSLSVSGFLSQYIRIEPTFVGKIAKNDTEQFTIFIEAPKYFTKGKHILNFTITGISKGTKITENRLVTLYIHEVARDEAIEYLNQSQDIINEMRDAGLNVKKILELLTKANEYFEEREYEDVKKIHDEIKKIRDNAFQVLSLLEEVEKEIVESEERGLKIPSAKNLFSMSKVAFMRGDFITALKRIEDTQNILSLETKGKINYIKLALDYWWAIVLGITISSITGYFIKLRLEIYRTTDRLRNLRFEEMSIMDKIREIKQKTFKENLMSMTDYHKAMYEYQKRLTDIRKEIAKLRTRRAGMKSIQTEIKNLEEEKKSIEKLIEETQISYFKKGEIKRSFYDDKMNALTEGLAEIEKNIWMLKLKQKRTG